MHKNLDLPMVIITIDQYHKAEDKKFLKQVVDDIYDAIFTYLEVRDLSIYKDDKMESFSFYYVPNEKSNLYLVTIFEQLSLLKEVEKKIKVAITHDRKDM